MLEELQPSTEPDSIQWGLQDGQRQPVWLDPAGDVIELSGPVWVAGKPAPCDPHTVETLRDRTRQCLRDMGFYFTRFDLRVTRNPGTGIASPVIQILDEGPQATLDDVNIKGNDRNTHQQILDYCGIRRNTTVTEADRRAIEERLWSSGRFSLHRVVVHPPVTPGDGQRMTIDLVEEKSVPPLSEAFSREERAMLKLRDWLEAFESRNEDLVIDWTYYGLTGEMIVSPTGDVMLGLSRADLPDEESHYDVIAFKDDHLAYYSPSSQYKFVVPWEAPLHARLLLRLLPREERRHHIKYGIG